MSSGGDLFSVRKLSGSKENQEISGEIIWLWTSVTVVGMGLGGGGTRGTRSLYLERKPDMFREHSVQALGTTGWCALHARTSVQGKTRQHLKKLYWYALWTGPQIATSYGKHTATMAPKGKAKSRSRGEVWCEQCSEPQWVGIYGRAGTHKLGDEQNMAVCAEQK